MIIWWDFLSYEFNLEGPLLLTDINRDQRVDN